MRQVIEQWCDYKRSLGIWSKSTTHNARKWGKRLCRFLQTECNISSLHEIEPQHLEVYRHKRLLTLTPATHASERDWLRSFFNWCVSQDLLLCSPVRDWKPIKVPKTTRISISKEDVEKVLAAININTLGGIQDRAIVETFYATAIRRAELVSLNLDDLDIATGKLFIHHGKGDKARIVPVTSSALFWIKLHLADARDKLVKDISCKALFIGKAGGRVTCAHISRMMKKLRQATGIDNLSPHILRHSCATHLMDANVPLPYVQKFLGHARISTTQRYLHVSNPQFKHSFDLAHPRDKWTIAPKKG